MRLIDADALLKQFPCTCACKNCGQDKDGFLPCAICTIIEKAPTVIGCGEWIPCSERLPEKQGQYSVSGGDKVWICDFLIFSNFKGGWCNNVSNPKVEAWMPLPEPYKKEGGEK